ncbi:hypothetical protein Tco_0655822 [Tanacetum coccineum]|uniref:Uncharacterized protein n=1 Tax=Tanacetum coccineum TaxID=301880 RepID=A0ABQ4X7I7_9ASTR
MGSNSLVCLGIELRGFKASTLGFTSALGTLLDFLVQLRMPFDREKKDGRLYTSYRGDEVLYIRRFISLEGFSAFHLCLMVIIVAVVIVTVIWVVISVDVIVGVVIVVAIIGVVVVVKIIGIVVVVVGGVPFIIKLLFVIIGWAYAFHQDKASLVRVPVANVTLSSSAHLLRENTDLVRSNQRMSPVFLLGFSMAAAYASRAAVTPSVISCRMASSVIVGAVDVDVLLGGIYMQDNTE